MLLTVRLKIDPNKIKSVGTRSKRTNQKLFYMALFGSVPSDKIMFGSLRKRTKNIIIGAIWKRAVRY